MRGRLWLNELSCICRQLCWPNHVWSFDFVEDHTHDGRKIRKLTAIDEFTRRCLPIVVDRSLNSGNMLRCQTDYFTRHGSLYLLQCPDSHGVRDYPLASPERAAQMGARGLMRPA